MKKSPFSANSINKAWAKTVTLPEFLQVHSHLPVEHVTNAFYEAVEIEPPVNTDNDGISIDDTKQIPKGKRARSSRTNAH